MIVVDGNDGTGKSTLVASLRALGYEVADRGLPTKLTDAVGPNLERAMETDDRATGELYVILDAPVEVSRARLAAANRDLDEKYHTVADLTYYRDRFRLVAERLGVTLVNAEGTPQSVLENVLSELRASPRLPRVAIPTGRLESGARGELGLRGYALEEKSRLYRLPVVNQIAPCRLKARSIPTAVALGMVEVGIVSTDIMRESIFDGQLEVVATFPRGMTRPKLCVLAAQDHLQPAPIASWQGANVVRGTYRSGRQPDRPVVIATEYPRLASQWAYAQSLAHVCVQTHGTTEAWVPDLADLAVDIVDTGDTAAANGLQIVAEVMAIDLVVIVQIGARGARHLQFVTAMRSPGC